MLDTAQGVELRRLPLAGEPLGVGLDLAGTRAYVATALANTVVVVDTSSGAVTGTLAVGAQPVGFGAFLGTPNGACPAAAVDCDDADPFTLDACTTAGACRHDPLVGLEAVRAGLGTLRGSLAATTPDRLGGSGAAGTLDRLLTSAQAHLSTAQSTPGQPPRRDLRSIAASLGRFGRTVRRSVRHGADRDLGLRLLDVARASQQHARRVGAR